MTLNEMTVAIAELNGYHVPVWHGDEYESRCSICHSSPASHKFWPDFSADLNAMHYIIRELPEKDKKAMRAFVWQIAGHMEPLPPASMFAQAYLMLRGKL